jgi:hypothetical protein
MDRKGVSHWVFSAATCRVRHGPSPASHAECDPILLRLSRGETLILVLLLSLGLWALIWGAVSLLAACGLQ